MANRARGEASFVTQDGRTLLLVVNYNAFAEAEDAADRPINDLLASMSKGRMKAIACIAYGALRESHPEIDLDEVGSMLLSADSAPLAEALRSAVNNAFSQEVVPEGSGNPPSTSLGTGTSSKRLGRKRD